MENAFLISFFLLYLLLIFCVVFLVLVLRTAVFLLAAAPLYQIARLRGVSRPWLSFIPYVGIFVVAELGGSRPFTPLGKTLPIPCRRQAAWAYIGLILAYFVTPLSLFTLLLIPIINIFVLVFLIPIEFFCFILLYIFWWRLHYDLLCELHPGDSGNLPLSIIGTVFPPVMIVVYWVLRGEELRKISAAQ